jgi:hypothetical protein
MRAPRIQHDHPVQILASTFLRALVEDDAARIWERLSRESRGLLEGLYAARARLGVASAAGVAALEGDARLADVVAPLRAGALAATGGAERLAAFGVSGTRLVDRETAYVLLLPDFGEERVVAEAEWRPAHLLAFTYESREWLVDLGKTAELSAEVELPDPLGEVRG